MAGWRWQRPWLHASPKRPSVPTPALEKHEQYNNNGEDGYRGSLGRDVGEICLGRGQRVVACWRAKPRQAGKGDTHTPVDMERDRDEASCVRERARQATIGLASDCCQTSIH